MGVMITWRPLAMIVGDLLLAPQVTCLSGIAPRAVLTHTKTRTRHAHEVAWQSDHKKIDTDGLYAGRLCVADSDGHILGVSATPPRPDHRYVATTHTTRSSAFSTAHPHGQRLGKSALLDPRNFTRFHKMYSVLGPPKDSAGVKYKYK